MNPQMLMNPNFLAFGAIAGVSVLAAVGVVALPNAVRSALCLVVNFFMLAFLYFTLGAELVGITQVVVYTGAIMVLFLFVIMLLNLGAPNALLEKKDPKLILGGLFGFVLFALILAQVVLPLKSIMTPTAPAAYGSPQAVGRTLFTEYVWPFELVSILLLVGLVGSIILAKRKF